MYFPDTLNVVCGADLPVTVILNCTDGVIDLTYANYGRTQPYNAVCHRDFTTEDTNCHHSIADQFSSCHGVPSCTVRDVYGGGADPCHRTYKLSKCYTVVSRVSM